MFPKHVPYGFVFDVLQGRPMQEGRAGGKDVVVPEMLKALTFGAVVKIGARFKERITNRTCDQQGDEDEVGSDWKSIDLVGIPKDKGPAALRKTNG